MSRESVLEDLAVAGRELSNAAVMFHAAASRHMGISAVEEKTIDLLQREGALTAGDIAHRTGLTPPSVTGLIDRLQSKGYVERTKDPDDGRRTLVAAHPQVTTRYTHLFASFGRALDRLHADYTEPELAVVADYMTRAAALQREATATLSDGEHPTSGVHNRD